jgi:tetratricopeptide (TPR) repeat protein
MSNELHQPSSLSIFSKVRSSFPARSLGACLLAAAMFASTAARGEDNGSWAGQTIMPRRAGTGIGQTFTGLLFRRQVYVAQLTDMVYTVLREQDAWLYVRHRGAEGWLAKEQAVLLDDAIDYFTQSIRANNQDAFALAHRGRAWKEEGELEKALSDLNEAIRLNPYTASWYSNRGMVYGALREYDNAIRDYDEAVRLDPADALTYNHRGIAYKGKKQYDQAIWNYGVAINLNPRSSDAYFNRGNAFKAKREYDGAVNDYSQAIRLDPNWADAYFNRANAHRARKAYVEAVRDLREVIRLDPKDADACSSLAWILATCPKETVRDGKRAVEYATKACDLTSWEASYFLATLAAAYAEIGDFEEALHWQKKALQSPQYETDEGDTARQRIKLFESRTPYREE